MADDPAEVDGVGGGGDDGCGWVCTLCTYHNAADKFKCEICDLRRGTSTRKPRCSTDTIVAQVMKQQEQIRQQTRAKPSPKSKAGAAAANLGASQQSSNDGPRPNKKSRASSASAGHDGGSKKASRSKNNDMEQSSELGESSAGSEEDSDESRDTGDEEQEPSRSKRKNPAKKRKQAASSSRKLPASNKKARVPARANSDNHLRDDYDEDEDSDEDDDDLDSDTTSVASDTLPRGRFRAEEPLSESSMDDRSPYSSSSAMTPEPTTSSPNHSASLGGKQLQDNPLKNRPIEVNGNMIKGNPPPTLSGRSGLIVDKKRFTQQSVTLDDTTITFTEFATRENKYVRKKKKRSRTARVAPTPTSGAVAEAD